MRNCSGSACIAALISLFGNDSSACSSAERNPAADFLCYVAQLLIGDLRGRVLLRLPLLLAVAVDVRVDQDPVQPCLEIGSLPERVKPGVGLHHGVLEQILRVLMVTRHPQCLRVERLPQRDDITFEPCMQIWIVAKSRCVAA